MPWKSIRPGLHDCKVPTYTECEANYAGLGSVWACPKCHKEWASRSVEFLSSGKPYIAWTAHR